MARGGARGLPRRGRRISRAAGLHDLRTRTSGTHHFAQFHVWVPADWTVREAHDCMDAIEEDAQRRFPGTEILIHLDPEGHTDRETMLPSAPHGEHDMTAIPFFQVDAFAERPLTGNPAAVMPLERLARRSRDAGDRRRE